MNITHYKVSGEQVRAVKSENINTVTSVKYFGFPKNCLNVLMFFFFGEKSSEKLSKHWRTIRKRFFHVKLKEKFPIPKRPCWLRNQILWKWLILLFSFLFFDRVWWRVWVKSLLSCPTLVSVYPLKGLYHAFCHFFQKAKTRLRINSVPGTRPTLRVLK